MYTEEVIDLVEDLEEFYENAGFADIHNRVLKDMSDEQIRKLHFETFKPVNPED